jgi:hypothetical protein
MKGLKKIALASAIAAVSAGAQAELKALDDSAMGELTGQAGLTIDLETKYTIGEFMYKDAGSVFLSGISLGANTNENNATDGYTSTAAENGFVDNIRIKLDIAGAGVADGGTVDFTAFAADTGNPTPVATTDNTLDTGFSRVRTLAGIQAVASKEGAGNADFQKFADGAIGETDITTAAAAAGLDTGNATGYDASGNATQDLTIEGKKVYGDGDLLIHVSFKDAWQKSGGLANLISTAGATGPTALSDKDFDTILTNGLKSVDFNFSIDAIGLASSAFDAGDSIGASFTGHTANGVDPDGDASTTVLISDLSINGYLGPVDIHIENKGNGFGTVYDASGNALGSSGVGAADSKINWNTYVNVTDLDVYLDIAGVQITDLKLNNVRGDVTDIDGNFAFGFAQSKRQIYAVRNAAGFDSSGLLADATAGTLYETPVAFAEARGLDGVAINTHFKGDMEIGALSFGDTGTSIGKLYWTDIESQTNWTISAH